MFPAKTLLFACKMHVSTGYLHLIRGLCYKVLPFCHLMVKQGGTVPKSFSWGLLDVSDVDSGEWISESMAPFLFATS